MSQIQYREEVIQIVGGGKFERWTSSQSKLKGWKSFLGMYAGNMRGPDRILLIGPCFFDCRGKCLFDLILDCLIGIYSLCWVGVFTAEIAVKIDWIFIISLEKICGKKIRWADIIWPNGILFFVFLAGRWYSNQQPLLATIRNGDCQSLPILP